MMMMMMMTMVLSHILQFWRHWRIPLEVIAASCSPKSTGQSDSNIQAAVEAKISTDSPTFLETFYILLYHQNPMMSSESECFRTCAISLWVFPTTTTTTSSWITITVQGPTANTTNASGSLPNDHPTFEKCQHSNVHFGSLKLNCLSIFVPHFPDLKPSETHRKGGFMRILPQKNWDS